MLKEKSRKHRISQERQDEINHENKLLYDKMTKILKKGAGNVSPVRRPAGADEELPFESKRASYSLHQGRSVTAEPNTILQRRINASHRVRNINAIGYMDQQEAPEDFELNPERKEPFKKRFAFGV